MQFCESLEIFDCLAFNQLQRLINFNLSTSITLKLIERVLVIQTFFGMVLKYPDSFRIVRFFLLCFSDTNDDDEYGLSNDKVKLKLRQNWWCQMEHLA